MSKGIVHTKASVVTMGAYLAGAVINLSFADLQYVVGACVGIFIHPDLDVDHGKVHSYKIVDRRFAYIGKVLWYPYRKSMRHGSMLSHLPVLSTLGRVAYLYLFVLVIPYLVLAPVLHLDFWGELEWWTQQLLSHYRIILGLMTTDLIHWALDVFTKENKRRINENTKTVPITSNWPYRQP